MYRSFSFPQGQTHVKKCPWPRTNVNCPVEKPIVSTRGVREPENIGNPIIGTSRKKSRTILQCYTAAYKIRKFTVQFLLPAKLLETRIPRIVWPDVYKRVTACLILGHYVRCWAVSLRHSGGSDVYFKICVNLTKIKNLSKKCRVLVRVKLW